MKINSLNKILSILISIIALSVNGQNLDYAFGNPDANILYRGYKNKLIIALDNSCSNCTVKGENLSLSKTSEYWIAKPGGGNTAQLFFIDSLTSDTTKTILFKVYNLPAPQLYFGAHAPGEKVHRGATRIDCKYGPEVPLRADFKVRSITLYSDSGRTLSCEGNELSQEMQNELRSISSPSQFNIVCRVAGPDGIVRQIGANYKL